METEAFLKSPLPGIGWLEEKHSFPVLCPRAAEGISLQVQVTCSSVKELISHICEREHKKGYLFSVFF